LGHNLRYLRETEGYKAVYEHFEDLVNSLYRSKDASFEYIRGIEAVFGYIDSGIEAGEKAAEELEEFKDEI
jgi:hypothetical protein